MKHSRLLLGCKTLCADGQLKGARRYTRKDKAPFPVGLNFLLAGLSLMRKRHLGRDNEVSILIDHGAADDARRFILTLIGDVLPSRNFAYLRLSQNRKIAEQETNYRPEKDLRRPKVEEFRGFFPKKTTPRDLYQIAVIVKPF